ncbi:hypothetical protein BD626DRAFT_560246 [Schizophyllum amplum]|uniref:Uncharacterized protein n=1 Tax=Schizophyllum amplum TaxID=97359 RepID=A0A550BYS9_9AGAR|nr:hypothetical protein BD626DRAFT_560246 [Auriculariopsis ampla]
MRILMSALVLWTLLSYADTASSEEVTLWTVVAETQEMNPSIVAEYSRTASAVGTASDGAATTYVEELAISRLEHIYTDTDETLTLISKLTTKTNTFVEGASTFFVSESGLRATTTWSGHIETYTDPSWVQECSFDQDEGKGSCVVKVGTEGAHREGETASFTGSLIAQQTLEVNGAPGRQDQSLLKAGALIAITTLVFNHCL